MKKLLSLSAILFTVALVFMGCKQQVEEQNTDPFSDCSESVTSIEMSDGTWTITTSDTSASGNISYTSDVTYKATVSDGALTITSGTTKMVMKTKDVLGDTYSSYTALSAAEKEEVNKVFLAELKNSFGPSYGTVTEATMNDENVSITLELSSTMLAYAEQMFNPANLPSGSTIKTNSDKTKYIITVTTEDKTLVYYATKD